MNSKLVSVSVLKIKYVGTSTLWQYGLLSFQAGYTKLERFLPKNQHTYPKEIHEF